MYVGSIGLVDIRSMNTVQFLICVLSIADGDWVGEPKE
jgi:hypothetical protein